MKATKELVLKTQTVNMTDATPTLAKFAKGARPMKSMVGVKSFRPRGVTQVAQARPATTEAR